MNRSLRLLLLFLACLAFADRLAGRSAERQGAQISQTEVPNGRDHSQPGTEPKSGGLNYDVALLNSGLQQQPYDPHADYLYRLYLGATVVGVVGGLIGIAILIIQTVATRRAAIAARDNADAATASGEISRLAMIAGNRAYVHHQEIKMISHYDENKGQIFWRITPRWINSGNTPARNLEIYTSYELGDSLLPDDFPFIIPSDIKRLPMNLAPKGLIGGMSKDIPGREVLAIKEGRKHLYIWGVARYHDVFPNTSPHVTKFCTFSGSVVGDPLVHWSDSNKVEITFMTHNRHNCTDDDCENQELAITVPLRRSSDVVVQRKL